MNLCDAKHEKVCYEGNTCPLCEAIDEYTDGITEKEDYIIDLENEIEDLKSKIKNMEEQS